ncbi:septum formation initiator family protein [Paludibacter sp.]
MQLKFSGFLKLLRLILLNKYSIVIIGFVLYMTFFDNYNWIDRKSRGSEIKKLESEYKFYLDEIEQNKNTIYKLNNDSLFLEKFAREKYYMKNDDEDVFILK